MDNKEMAEDDAKNERKNLEEERAVMRVRVKKFLSIMACVQGDREFSIWEGSVVDSVVGAFLTQNVQDIRSSSAYMHLASEYPIPGYRADAPGGELSRHDSVQFERDGSASSSKQTFGNSKIVLASSHNAYRPSNSCQSLVLFTPQQPCTCSRLIYEGSGNDNHPGSHTATSSFWSEMHTFMSEWSHSEFIPHRSTGKQISRKQNRPGKAMAKTICNVHQPVGDSRSEPDYTRNHSPLNCSRLRLTKREKYSTVSTCSAVALRKVADPVNQGHLKYIEFRNDETSRTVESGDICEEPKALVAESSQVNQPSISRVGVAKVKPMLAKSGTVDRKFQLLFRGNNTSRLTNEILKSWTSENIDGVDWEAIRVASVNDIARIIRLRGTNFVLASRIKAFLNRIKDQFGSVNLQWLKSIPAEKARSFLLSVKGLGVKSVDCIQLLSLHQSAFPVDVNVARISVRLGWVPLQPLPVGEKLHTLKSYPRGETVQVYLWQRLCTLPLRTLYRLHCQMITFGKVFCTKTSPNCRACPLRGDCDHFASATAREGDEVLSLPSAEGLKAPVAAIESAEVREATGITIEELNIIEGQGDNLASLYEDLRNENNTEFSEQTTGLALVPRSIYFKPAPKLKEIGRRRTVHSVYELPDNHPLLKEFEPRVKDDLCMYLLAIRNSSETSHESCSNSDTVEGTILVPCRTAMRGKFPLNGSYFQVNEVFADHQTSICPINVPRDLLWSLNRRFVYFGLFITAIFRDLTLEKIRECFCEGYVCVRGFDRYTRAPKPLVPALHKSAMVNDDNDDEEDSQ